MKNNKWEGSGGGLKEKGLINFLPLEREHLVQRGGLFERGGGGEEGLKRGFAVSNKDFVYKPLSWLNFGLDYRSSPILYLGTTLAGCLQQK